MQYFGIFQVDTFGGAEAEKIIWATASLEAAHDMFGGARGLPHNSRYRTREISIQEYRAVFQTLDKRRHVEARRIITEEEIWTLLAHNPISVRHRKKRVWVTVQ
jgi:hypothetical protein